MQHSVENQADVDLFTNLHTDNEVQTTTSITHKPSEALLRKCLHPPSSVPEFCGLPTNDARSQVCIEWRNMELMQGPKIYREAVVYATPQDLANFDYAFLIPNGARVKSIGFVYNPDESRMFQDLGGVMVEQLYNFNHWRDDVNLYRPTYKSSTFYLNATAFNDTGMVVGNQFNPNILFSGNLLNMSTENPTLFYAMVKALHKMQNVIIQRPTREQIQAWEKFTHYHRTEMLRTVSANPTDILNLDPNTTHQIVSFGRLAPTTGIQNVPSTSQILGNSLRSLGCKAKEGMFSVQRLNTINPAWLTGSNTFSGAPGIKGLYQCWFSEIDGTSDDFIIQPFYENANIGTTATDLNALFDTLWSKDMTWSWVRFSGLSLNSQTSVNTQLIIKKVYTGIEVQPCPASAWSGMMKLAPKPDLTALQAMMDGFYELKDVMPARYNFWGTIASIAANGAKTFGANLLTDLAGKLLGGERKTKNKQPVKQSKGKQQPNKIANKGRPPWAEITQTVKQLEDRVASLDINNGKRRRRNTRRGPRNVPRVPAKHNKLSSGRPNWAS